MPKPQTIFIVPAEGMKIRNPQTGKHLNAEGEKVVLSSYWSRCLLSGDVTKSKPKPQAKDSSLTKINKTTKPKETE